jgi:hypothetical protein
MAGALGWSAHETMRQVERYHEQLQMAEAA